MLQTHQLASSPLTSQRLLTYPLANGDPISYAISHLAVHSSPLLQPPLLKTIDHYTVSNHLAASIPYFTTIFVICSNEVAKVIKSIFSILIKSAHFQADFHVIFVFFLYSHNKLNLSHFDYLLLIDLLKFLKSFFQKWYHSTPFCCWFYRHHFRLWTLAILTFFPSY